jgi:hypothetical protein
MYTVINSQADLSTLVTLAEAKRQCRVDPSFTLDDDELTDFSLICTELAQTYTNRLLTVGSVSIEVEDNSTVIQLPWGNVTTIDEVLLDDDVTTEFTFSPITQKLKITASATYSNVKVTYTAGYTTLPVKVKQGILVMISTMYNHREDVATGTTVEELPLTSRRLLDTVKYRKV